MSLLSKLKENVNDENLFLPSLKSINKQDFISVIKDESDLFFKERFFLGFLKAFDFGLNSILDGVLSDENNSATKEEKESLKVSLKNTWLKQVSSKSPEELVSCLWVNSIYGTNIVSIIRSFISSNNEKAIFETSLFNLHIYLNQFKNDDDLIIRIISVKNLKTDLDLKERINHQLWLKLTSLKENLCVTVQSVDYYLKAIKTKEKDESIENYVNKASVSSRDLLKGILPIEIYSQLRFLNNKQDLNISSMLMFDSQEVQSKQIDENNDIKIKKVADVSSLADFDKTSDEIYIGKTEKSFVWEKIVSAFKFKKSKDKKIESKSSVSYNTPIKKKKNNKKVAYLFVLAVCLYLTFMSMISLYKYMEEKINASSESYHVVLDEKIKTDINVIPTEKKETDSVNEVKK